MRGYSAIGMFEPKTKDNLGTLIRSAYCFNADFVFTIGNRYSKQASDTADATRHMPLFHYENIEDFFTHLPARADVVAIEITSRAKPLETCTHPERAIYILGGEDRTLPDSLLDRCQQVRSINTKLCLNVASAGTVVLYDREMKVISGRI